MFHKWPLNGYVHKIHHGDWFGGKGVGLCKIKVRNMNINVYIAHVRLSNALFRYYSLMIFNYALNVICVIYWIVKVFFKSVKLCFYKARKFFKPSNR